MTEAQITCTTGQIQIPDLNLDLVDGQIAYVDESRARASKDLQRAWGAHGVAVVYMERSRVRRAAASKQAGFPVPTGKPASLPPDPLDSVQDPDAIVERVVAAMGGPALEMRIRNEVGRQMAAMESRLSDVLVMAVERALTNRPVQVVEQGGSMGRVGGDDTPVFIPSRIADQSLTADISVRSQKGDDTGLNDAASALRLVRKAPEKP